MGLRGTPIERIRDINEAMVDRLRFFGLNSIESFLSLCRKRENRVILQSSLMLSETAI